MKSIDLSAERNNKEVVFFKQEVSYLTRYIHPDTDTVNCKSIVNIQKSTFVVPGHFTV